MIVVSHSNGEIKIEGHAGYAKMGEDIVCAAVSALTLTFIASVEELTQDNLKCDIKAGNTFIQYRNLSAAAKLLLDSFFVGIRMIADDYPDYVRVTRRESL